MNPNCRDCEFCKRSPYSPRLDMCVSPERSSEFADIERKLGNCGNMAVLFKNRTTRLPKIQVFDYCVKYAWGIYVPVLILVTLYIITKILG